MNVINSNLRLTNDFEIGQVVVCVTVADGTIHARLVKITSIDRANDRIVTDASPHFIFRLNGKCWQDNEHYRSIILGIEYTDGALQKLQGCWIGREAIEELLRATPTYVLPSNIEGWPVRNAWA